MSPGLVRCYGSGWALWLLLRLSLYVIKGFSQGEGLDKGEAEKVQPQSNVG
jgi:hypothetical protein